MPFTSHFVIWRFYQNRLTKRGNQPWPKKPKQHNPGSTLVSNKSNLFKCLQKLKLCRLSAVLKSFESMFLHFGARIIKRHVFVDGYLHPISSEEVVSQLADAKRCSGCGKSFSQQDRKRKEKQFGLVEVELQVVCRYPLRYVSQIDIDYKCVCHLGFRRGKKLNQLSFICVAVM